MELLLALLTTLTGIQRDVSPELSAIAQRRAVEISCEGCFSHAGWVYGRDGEAEIIAWTYNLVDPVPQLAAQWQASPPHWGHLMDPKWTNWGCAIYQTTSQSFGVCLFSSGAPVIQPPPPSLSPVIEFLPNTAMEAP